MDYLDSFDVDPKGNIYIYNGEQLLKFNNKGFYVQTFGRKGQSQGSIYARSSRTLTEDRSFASTSKPKSGKRFIKKRKQ
jgi:hypothetical protein